MSGGTSSVASWATGSLGPRWTCPALDAWSALLRALAWHACPVRPLGLTVKATTSLQLGPPLQELADRHGAFIAEAYGPEAPGPAALAEFRTTLRRPWGLRWESCHKETLWRLAVHGAAGFPAITAQTPLHASAHCPCGAPITGDGAYWVRWHLFWIALPRARCGKRWRRRWGRRSGSLTLRFSAATSGA
jgi:hypothetical protein